jgi:hypothetical protein
MVSHSDVILEHLVLPTQGFRSLYQLRLAEGWDGSVRDVVFRNADVCWDSCRNERIHGVIPELLEHVRGLSGVRANVSVGESVERGEG